jgi:hypothetical protein
MFAHLNSVDPPLSQIAEAFTGGVLAVSYYITNHREFKGSDAAKYDISPKEIASRIYDIIELPTKELVFLCLGDPLYSTTTVKCYTLKAEIRESFLLFLKARLWKAKTATMTKLFLSWCAGRILLSKL